MSLEFLSVSPGSCQPCQRLLVFVQARHIFFGQFSNSGDVEVVPDIRNFDLPADGIAHGTLDEGVIVFIFGYFGY